MAIKERRYARMAELQRKIAALQNVREHVPLSFLLPKFTPQERDKALVLMHQVFVFADMLYGAALEFEEYLKGFDRSVTLPVVVRAKKAAAECRDITRYVDSFGDERMSTLFGEMCDEISLNAQNVIYRHVRKETKKTGTMRKKMLLWVIRLIRLFHKEDQFIPQLRSVPEGKVLPNRLYRHFGRILVSRANPQKVEMRYYYAEIDPAMSVRPKDDDWKECSEIHYNELMTRKDAVTKYEQTGAPCEHCACQIYGLPCHCAFPRGAMTGYFELLHCNKQYSNNPTI